MVADIRRSVPPQTAPTVSPDLALVAGVLAACLRQGGPAAEPLDRAAGILRARAAEAGERTTQSAQARLSAQVMTALPAAMLAVLIATSASVRVAVSTPAGATALLAGAALNVAGWWWLRRLLRNAAM
jgi:tight adherence protein B